MFNLSVWDLEIFIDANQTLPCPIMSYASKPHSHFIRTLPHATPKSFSWSIQCS